MTHARALSLILLVAACAACAAAPVRPEQAPALPTKGWIGAAPAPAAGRWTLVAFFDPDWSASHRMMWRLRRQSDVTVVGVADAGKKRLETFAESLDITYPLLASGGDVIQEFGAKVPSRVLIRPDGRLVRDDAAIEEQLYQLSVTRAR